MTLSHEISSAVKLLIQRYNAEYVIVFGSFARGEETPSSDIDLVVFGGEKFKKTNIFAFAEDLRLLTGRDVDAFEESEIDLSSKLYSNILSEGVRIA